MSATGAAAGPPYLRIKRELKHALARGRYPPGARMPSEAELVDDGLVVREKGRGTFAAQPHRVSSSLTIRDIHEEILARGHVHEARVHLAREERASATVANRLSVRAGAPVFHTLIVHCEDGVPLQCEDRYVNPAAAPDYLGVDFARTTPTRYLLDVVPLWEAQVSIAATTPTRQEARLLGIASSDPCLVVLRRTESHQVPITIARLAHPGSRYLLEGQFKP